MGFYSIYKIIKDIIRTLFGNKILKIIIILSIIFCVIFFFNKSSVFALNSTDYTSVTINNTEYLLDIDYILSNYDYYFLLNQSFKSGSYYYTNYYLFLSNNPLTVDYTTSNTYISRWQFSLYYC